MPRSDDDERREERARGRQSWPVRRTDLDDDGLDRLRAETTPEERIAMMDALAREAWQLAGLPFPADDRAHAPVRRTTLADT